MERLRVEWEQDLEVPSWYEPPDTVVVDLDHWQDLTNAERWELLARECAQHVLAAVYPARPRGWQRSKAWRQEERGRRAALEFLVDDRLVVATSPWGVIEGRAVEAWELAEQWGRSAAWCAERVRLWRRRHPELAALVGPL